MLVLSILVCDTAHILQGLGIVMPHLEHHLRHPSVHAAPRMLEAVPDASQQWLMQNSSLGLPVAPVVSDAESNDVEPQLALLLPARYFGSDVDAGLIMKQSSGVGPLEVDFGVYSGPSKSMLAVSNSSTLDVEFKWGGVLTHLVHVGAQPSLTLRPELGPQALLSA